MCASNLNYECINPEIYAIVGASAFLSGVTHLTSFIYINFYIISNTYCTYY